MHGDFFLKINKRACTSIRHTRVAIKAPTDNEKDIIIKVCQTLVEVKANIHLQIKIIISLWYRRHEMLKFQI